MIAIKDSSSPSAVIGGVRLLLQCEGLALFAAALGVYAHQSFGWGWFTLFFLAPDITLAAYVCGPRLGAAAYNAAHSTIGPLTIGAAGLALGSTRLEMAALIGLAHIGFDRAIGDGLKYSTAFGDTHLGRK